MKGWNLNPDISGSEKFRQQTGPVLHCSTLALLQETDVNALPVKPCSKHRLPCHAAFASAPLAPVWIHSRDEGVHLQIICLLLLLTGSSEWVTQALCKALASCSQGCAGHGCPPRVCSAGCWSSLPVPKSGGFFHYQSINLLHCCN